MRVASVARLVYVVAVAAPLRGQTPSPGVRSGGVMTYDAARGHLLMFGGTSGDAAYPNELWAWDGRTWQKLEPKDGVAPPGRDAPHFQYDVARQRAVLFAGRREPPGGSVELLGDMWEWDGVQWREIKAALPVLHAVTAYDPIRRRVVAYGGLDHSGLLKTLREWDGASWTVRDTAGPGLAAAAAVTPSGELTLLGLQSGRASDSVASAISTWNGTTWTRGELGPALTSLQPTASAPDGTIYLFQTPGPWLATPILHVRTPVGAWRHVSLPVQPSGHGSAAAGYDPRRGRFVLYGGRSAETWEFDGREWIKR